MTEKEMNMKRRLSAVRLSTVTTVAALVLASAACTSAPSPQGGGRNVASNVPSAAELAAIDASKVKKSLVVGVDNPHYIFSEDIVVARDKGYFKEVGIDSVEIKILDEPIPGLIGGSLDLVAADTEQILSAAKQSAPNLRYLAVNFGQEFIGLAVRPGINTVADLGGKTIGAGIANSRTDSNIRELLTANGVDLDSVKLANTGGTANDRLKGLLAGTFDAATLQARQRKFIEDAGGKFLLETTRPAPQNGWAADKLLSESPETAAAFLAAVLKARAYIENIDHKDEVLKMMTDAGYDIPAEYASAYSFENSPEYHTADGGFEEADMDKFVADSIKFETMPAGTDWRDYTDLTPLWRAQKQLGLPLHPAPSDFA
jgi:ABC-type nitrate/sulfonate/bicarbonate transport system substrate-binding protein